MRLLKADSLAELSIVHFNDGTEIPEYAILSHTWYDDHEEITFSERMLDPEELQKRKSWSKIVGSKKQAQLDGFKYIWIDTLCIDKDSSTELTEAINSMYRYYHEAQVCYVYLNDMPSPARLLGTSYSTDQQRAIFGEDFDVALHLVETAATAHADACKRSLSQPQKAVVRQSSDPTSAITIPHGIEPDLECGSSHHHGGRAESTSPMEKPKAVAMRMDANDGACLINLQAFRRCRWFTRGWTLQELLAPEKIVLFSTDWTVLPFDLLKDEICAMTRIHKEALTKTRPIATFSVAQRMSWAAGRVTRRPEDRAYSLMGIFGVNFAILYGEGNAAFQRLQEEIMRVWSYDQTVFVFDRDISSALLLARSPDQFHDSNDVVTTGSPDENHFRTTSRAVTYNTLIQSDGSSRNIGHHLYLACTRENDYMRIMLLNIVKHESLSAKLWPIKRETLYKLERRTPLETIDMRYAFRGRFSMLRSSVSVLRDPEDLDLKTHDLAPWPRSAHTSLVCRFWFSELRYRTGWAAMNGSAAPGQDVNWTVSGTCSNGSWDASKELFNVPAPDSKNVFKGRLEIFYKGRTFSALTIRQHVIPIGPSFSKRGLKKWKVKFDSPAIHFPLWFLDGYCVQLKPRPPYRVIVARGLTFWPTPDSVTMPMIDVEQQAPAIVVLEIFGGIMKLSFDLLLNLLQLLSFAVQCVPYTAYLLTSPFYRNLLDRMTNAGDSHPFAARRNWPREGAFWGN